MSSQRCGSVVSCLSFVPECIHKAWPEQWDEYTCSIVTTTEPDGQIKHGMCKGEERMWPLWLLLTPEDFQAYERRASGLQQMVYANLIRSVAFWLGCSCQLLLLDIDYPLEGLHLQL